MLLRLPVHLMLSPVLVTQALYVRARAMMLPEPPGDRRGVAGQGQTLRLLVFGDSAAAGVGAPSLDQSVMGHLVRRLSAFARVEYDLVAVSGARTGDTLAWLDDLPCDHYDIVLTSLGVNDVTKAVPCARWLRQQAALFDRLTNEFGVRRILVTGLPPMERFPLLPHPLRWFLGHRAAQFDAARKPLIDARPNCTAIPVDPVLAPDLMADDGFHPGPVVHAVWAERAMEAILADPSLLDGVQGTA